MNYEKFKIITESKNFIYFVTAQDKESDWFFKIAVKNNAENKFKNSITDKNSGYNVILKIKLAQKHCPHYKRLSASKDSPYKIMDLSRPFRDEIKKTIINTDILYEGEKITNYEYAIVLWEELNPENLLYYETPNQELAWLTTPLPQDITGLKMCVELVLQSMGEIINQPPYIIIQNNYGKFGTERTKSWVKMQLDGTVLEDKKLVFKKEEIAELKNWIEINKLPILLYWTQEENSSIDIIKLIKSVEVNNEQK